MPLNGQSFGFTKDITVKLSMKRITRLPTAMRRKTKDDFAPVVVTRELFLPITVQWQGFLLTVIFYIFFYQSVNEE